MQYILNETVLYGTNNAILMTISVLSILLSLYVIISKNPVISILFLIGLFFSISMYLITIGLHFLGLSYLLVYIGAVSIFFIFIIMLINIRVSELLTDNRNSAPLALLTVVIFNYFIVNILPVDSIYNVLNNFKDVLLIINLSDSLEISMEDTSNVNNIINIATRSWDIIIVSCTHMSSIGSVLYTNFYILLMITSLILLLSMVGSIVVTMG